MLYFDQRIWPITAFTGFLLDKEATGKSHYTIRNYKHTFKKVRRFLNEEDPLLENMDREDWVGFFAWLQRQKVGGAAPRDELLSGKTIYNVYTNLSAFYSWAVSIGLSESNIIKTIEPPDYQLPQMIPFTREQLVKMLRACNKTATWRNRDIRTKRPTAKRDQAIIRLLLSTGIRASELCGIQMKHLNLEQRSLIVYGKSKGRDPKSRPVFFGLRTQRAIWYYLTTLPTERPDDASLFLSSRGPTGLTPNALYQLISRLGERVGINDCKPHRFRHTFAITYLRNGGDVLTLQALLGHTSLEMVRHYARIAAQDCQRVHQTADPVDNWNL